MIIPRERIIKITYSPRQGGRRDQRGHAEQNSVLYHQTIVADVLATTTPLTPVDPEDIIRPGRFDWDIFTFSNVPDALVGELLERLRLLPGFLHACRPDPASRLSYAMLWEYLMACSYVSEGVALESIGDEEGWESGQRGYVDDRGAREIHDGIFVNLDFIYLPELRFAHIPIPIPLRRSKDAAPYKVPIAHDALTRAGRSMPYSITKTHKFDEPDEPAQFRLPEYAADRMPDYRQVEERVRVYCLTNAEKAAGFAAVGFYRSPHGVRALADQLLSVLNSPDARIYEARVMSDGTVQFSQAVVVASPRGKYTTVDVAWNFKHGQGLRLSSAYRADRSGPVDTPMLIDGPRSAASDPDIFDAGLAYGWNVGSQYVPSGRIVNAGVLVPVDADKRTLDFRRALMAASVGFGRRLRQGEHDYFVSELLWVNAPEGFAVPATLALVDWLRAHGVHAFPLVEP